MIQCPFCLQEVDDGSNYCQFCGKKLSGVTPQIQPAPSPPMEQVQNPLLGSYQSPPASREAYTSQEPATEQLFDPFQALSQPATDRSSYQTFQKPSTTVQNAPDARQKPARSISTTFLTKRSNLPLFIGIGAVILLIIAGSVIGFMLMRGNEERDPVAQTAAANATMAAMVAQMSGGTVDMAATPVPGQDVASGGNQQAIAPQNFSGTGNTEITIQPITQSIVAMHANGNTNGNYFGIDALLNDGSTDPLVNTSEPYDGIIAITDANKLSSIKVTAEGDWSIEIYDIQNLPSHNTSSKVSGSSDSLYRVVQNSNSLHINGNAQSKYFSVTVYPSSGFPELLVNVTEPYDGTVTLPNTIYLIEVRATGEWSINP